MNAVIASQVLPSETTVATVQYADGTNDGYFTVRFVNGGVTTIHMTAARRAEGVYVPLTSPVRVTKSSAPNVYYGVVGVFYEWLREQETAALRIDSDRPLEAQALLTVAFQMDLNLTAREDGTDGWTEAEITGYAKAKLDEALAAIEDMVPEGTPAGGVLVTRVVWTVTDTEVEGLAV